MPVAVKVQSCPTGLLKPKVDKFTGMAKELFGDKVEFTSEDGEKGVCVISIEDVVYERKGKGKGKGKDKDKDKDKEGGDEEGKGKGKDKDKEKDKEKDKDKDKDKE